MCHRGVIHPAGMEPNSLKNVICDKVKAHMRVASCDMVCLNCKTLHMKLVSFIFINLNILYYHCLIPEIT